MTLYDSVCTEISELVTKSYTTSFYYGIRLLGKELRAPIYNIYGFVRFADEIVDTFHHEEAALLLDQFIEQTWQAIDLKISTNPILQSFQLVFHQYSIEKSHVEAFFHSMKMDLKKTAYTKEEYDKYILGSAEVVGLMCLHVFCKGNKQQYEELKPGAMKLGSAFQKINFLRDLKADNQELGRTYFPNVDLLQFNEAIKKEIEADIEEEFQTALNDIKRLPKSAKKGVYVAWLYYHGLLQKIKSLPANHILNNRVRITNTKKILLMGKARFDVKIGRI